MGTVYAVVHCEIGKHAALKVVHRKLATPHQDRMLLEAQVVNRVGHPNIVDIFETGHLPDGRQYLVMERLEGQPLAYRADDGKLRPNDVIAILLQICDALIAAHAAGIVHRDLKLDNVFLVDNPDDPTTPRVKLLDWGIAKEIESSQRHTIDGQLVGTPQYLSPEQARGAVVSAKTDVYSLGVMAYELFLDQLPFEAETAAEIMTMHLRATPPPASDVWPEIPTELEELIHEMLAKNPSHRPTMLEVARRLEALRPAFASAPAYAELLPKSQILRSQILNSRAARPTSIPPMPSARPRWQLVIGATAIAVSALLFVASHLAESTTAAAAATVEANPSLHPRPLTAKPDIIPDPMPRVEASPAATAAVVAPVEPVVQPAPKAAPRPTAAQRAAKLAPAVPRRNSKQDPDGTLDPYR